MVKVFTSTSDPESVSNLHTVAPGSSVSLFSVSTTVTKVCDSWRCLTLVVSHFTDFSLFVFLVHVFKDSIIVFLNLYFRVLYEFFFFFVRKCYWWLNTESKLNIYFFRLRKIGLGCSRWCMDPSSWSLWFFLQSVYHCQCWYFGGLSCFFWATWRPLLVCCGMIATLQDPTLPTKCRPSLRQKEGYRTLFFLRNA